MNIPTKLFEYMGAGLPVVASDLPSIRPFVEPDRNGILVPSDDPHRHAEALIYLLQHPDEAAAMGQQGDPWSRHSLIGKLAPCLLAVRSTTQPQ
ncbi:MAG: glycosyltransferase [Chloroflexota bacterium]